MVARLEVETSTGKKRPWGRRKALSWSSTMPGSTTMRRLSIEFKDAVEVGADIDDDGLTDRLAALGGAAAARQDRHALRGRDLHDAGDVGLALRRDHANRLDLVDRGVGGVAAAGEWIEANLAFDGSAEAGGERAVADAPSRLKPPRSALVRTHAPRSLGGLPTRLNAILCHHKTTISNIIKIKVISPDAMN